jgi:hypothetical protein
VNAALVIEPPRFAVTGPGFAVSSLRRDADVDDLGYCIDAPPCIPRGGMSTQWHRDLHGRAYGGHYVRATEARE